MPMMQIDSDEVEELSERVLAVVNQYMTEVAELNASEVALALSLVFHKLWKDTEGEDAAKDAAADPAPAPARAGARPAAPQPAPPQDGAPDDEGINSFLDG